MSLSRRRLEEDAECRTPWTCIAASLGTPPVHARPQGPRPSCSTHSSFLPLQTAAPLMAPTTRSSGRRVPLAVLHEPSPPPSFAKAAVDRLQKPPSTTSTGAHGAPSTSASAGASPTAVTRAGRPARATRSSDSVGGGSSIRLDGKRCELRRMLLLSPSSSLTDALQPTLTLSLPLVQPASAFAPSPTRSVDILHVNDILERLAKHPNSRRERQQSSSGQPTGTRVAEDDHPAANLLAGSQSSLLAAAFATDQSDRRR